MQRERNRGEENVLRGKRKYEYKKKKNGEEGKGEEEGEMEKAVKMAGYVCVDGGDIDLESENVEEEAR